MLLKANAKEDNPVPSGVHFGICYGVIDIGNQWNEFYSKFAPEVIFLWELPDERITIERDGVKKDLPRGISRKFTQSLATKSKLKPFIEGWRGRPFTEEELKGFDPKKVIGHNSQIQVNHKPGTGKNLGRIFSEVVAAIPLPKGTPSRKAENPHVWFSWSDVPAGVVPELPASLPEWIVKLIKESREWKERTDPSHVSEPAPGATTEDDSADVPF